MSNVVKFSITGDTNAEQVAGRAKAAVSGLDKQLEGIGNKFKNSFKDIFLSFLGPMALLGTAIAFIGKIISDNEKKREEANQAAIDGTNELMSAEDRYWARKQDREKKGRENVEQAKLTREEVTKNFLQTDPRGRKMLFDYAEEQYKKGSNKVGPGFASEDKQMQDKVQAIIAEEAKKNPIEPDKPTTFKGPEGFSNVVGVGANPVIEAMTAQLDEIKKTNELLTQIAGTNNGRTGSWMAPSSGSNMGK